MKEDLQAKIDKAVELLTQQKDLDTAEQIFNEFLNIDLDSPVLLFYLASVKLCKKEYGLAHHLYKLSLNYDSDSPSAANAWNNYGYTARELFREEEAIKGFEKSIEILPDNGDGWANLGSMYIAKGVPDKAIELLDKSLSLSPGFPMARWNRSLALLEKGKFKEGFSEYAATYLHRNGKHEEGKAVDRKYICDKYPEGLPIWDGTPGKTVIVFGEQGIGDEIMFSSMLNWMQEECDVIFDAHPRLADIFRNSFPDMPIYGTRKEKEIFWPGTYDKIDARICISSLPSIYAEKKGFYIKPYLKADPILEKKYEEKLRLLGDKPKIGISWRGGTKHTGLKDRTMKLKEMLPFFNDFDADYISLQYTEEAAAHVEDFKKTTGINIHHWQDTINDYDETAALVANLDLIISVPQSVVHLAGALGTFTYQLVPKRALWQMGAYGEDMPWYAAVKNIWQDENESWATVIGKLKEEICTLSPTIIAS